MAARVTQKGPETIAATGSDNRRRAPRSGRRPARRVFNIIIIVCISIRRAHAQKIPHIETDVDDDDRGGCNVVHSVGSPNVSVDKNRTA